MEARVQGRGRLPLRLRDRAYGGVREAHTHPFDRTAGLQVHRSRVGGLADGHIESQVPARNGGCRSRLSSRALMTPRARGCLIHARAEERAAVKPWGPA